MNKKMNPFHELYVTEIVGADSYIKLFSPYLCNHALLLFQPGNVVLKGTKGNGKSMLLKLLSPDMRIAYDKAGKEFPVPKEFRNFIGAGINLLRSGITDFGQRAMKSEKADQDIIPLYFGDFFNYWIVLDLLESIEKLQVARQSSFANDVGINDDPALLNECMAALSADDCWFGYLDGVDNFKHMKERLSQRIRAYRAFLNFNADTLQNEIIHSKTRIGEPISRTVKRLKECNIIEPNCHVFIKVDQLEELTRMEALLKNSGVSFREMVNKALGMRDPYVSYRIGSRRYAWHDNLTIFGTEAQIEEERDYKIIDIDELLRRKESPRTWIFPDFAEDVFRRRIEYAFQELSESRNLLKQIFGPGLSQKKLAMEYAGNSSGRVISVDTNWPKPWRDFLYALAEDDPFAARLAEAWCRQKDKKKREVMFEIPCEKPFPWDEKPYWKKERTGQALMQIAARCAQKMIWAGEKAIISLSGGNILAFLSLCNYIWAAWIRDTRNIESRIRAKTYRL